MTEETSPSKPNRSVSQWAAIVTLTTTVSAIFLYYLGHSFTMGWLERAGLPPNLFPISSPDVLIDGGQGMSIPVLKLLLTPQGMAVTAGLAFVNIGLVLVAALVAIPVQWCWERMVRPKVLSKLRHRKFMAILRFYREHRHRFGGLGKTLLWLFSYPFIAYYALVVVGGLFIFTTFGMYTAGQSSAARIVQARYQELLEPPTCLGHPRVSWREPTGESREGINLVCSQSVCGVITKMGVQTVKLSNIDSMYVPCPWESPSLDESTKTTAQNVVNNEPSTTTPSLTLKTEE